jgi:hypothetical protein
MFGIPSYEHCDTHFFEGRACFVSAYILKEYLHKIWPG